MVLIAIGGKSGSGKTNIAKLLVSDLFKYTHNSKTVLYIGMDNFYKDTGLPEGPAKGGVSCSASLEKKSKKPGDMDYNYDHPDAFDWTAIEQTLQNIRNDKEIQIPIYDYAHSCQTGKFTTYKMPYDYIIFEGILALHNKIYDYFNITIFIDAKSDICLWRRIERDVIERGRTISSCGMQYFTVTKQGAEKFIEPMKKNANFILSNNEIVGLDDFKNNLGYKTLLKYIAVIDMLKVDSS